MKTQTIEAKKVFVSENQAQWIVFEEEMQAGFQYKLASIEDLHDYVAEEFTYIEGIGIATEEGSLDMEKLIKTLLQEKYLRYL
ncbi:hypothetical protein H7T43_25505 [Peribacillus simplex]|uniref:hypothetical protein n=1 Tax=Peribacillus simplex TaxID=1478 RepID=UPI002989DC29|nr:hypothetical protein [Peribacillus simplex]MBX9958204.1 hypothetical protein [Peribacillus simplex]